jgi:hypothetical protein
MHPAVLAEPVVTPALPVGTTLAILAFLAEAPIAPALTIGTAGSARPTLAEVAMSPAFLTAAAVALAEALAIAIHGVLVLVRAKHARQHAEARLLRIVEAGIERCTGIGDLLECSAALGHGIGSMRHPVKRRRRGGVLRTRLRSLRRSLPRLDTLNSQLDHVTHGLLKRWPIFGLIRCQLETGLHRCNPRIGECSDIVWTKVTVLGAGTVAEPTTMTVKTLLCIHKGRAGDGECGRRGDYGLKHVILHRCLVGG